MADSASTQDTSYLYIPWAWNHDKTIYNDGAAGDWVLCEIHVLYTVNLSVVIGIWCTHTNLCKEMYTWKLWKE